MSDIEKRTQEVLGLYYAESPDEAAILALVNQGVDVKQTDGDGCTLLHYAAYYDHQNVCTLLIQQKANIHARDILYNTPLEFADINEKPEVVKLLLEWGANIWAENNDSRPALHSDWIYFLTPHCDKWVPKLEAVTCGDFSEIEATQDIYHLASVMKPKNPKNVPEPKEFIRILFQQYLPHEEKFNAMYEEIFSHSRPPAQDLKAAREAAKSRGVAP